MKAVEFISEEVESKKLKKAAFMLNPILGHGKLGEFPMAGEDRPAVRWGNVKRDWENIFDALLVENTGILMFRMNIQVLGQRDLNIGANARDEYELLHKIGQNVRDIIQQRAPKSSMAKNAVSILEKLEQLK